MNKTQILDHMGISWWRNNISHNSDHENNENNENKRTIYFIITTDSYKKFINNLINSLFFRSSTKIHIGNENLDTLIVSKHDIVISPDTAHVLSQCYSPI